MAVQFKDYYETLGVAKNSTGDELKKAFRKLARQHHPDVSKDKKGAEAKFKEINEAYEVLGDPEKRKKYDTLGADWERGGPQPAHPGMSGFPPQRGGRPGGNQGVEFEFGGTGFSDFFEQFFGGGGGRQASPFGPGFSTQARERPGSDVEADILVTIEEAITGSRRKISLRRTGKSKVETYEVNIPAGVREGQRIRLAGQGEAGQNGALSGDLFLRVHFAQHPDFQVQGTDLIHELALAPWQAVLGCQAQVPTVEGEVRLKIPAGTQHGQRFRLKQRGLPHGKSRGELYVDVQIALPKELNDKERALWEQLAAESRNPAV